MKNGNLILRVIPVRASKADLIDELFDWGVHRRYDGKILWEIEYFFIRILSLMPLMYPVPTPIKQKIVFILFGSFSKTIKGNLDPNSDILQSTPEQCRLKSLECMNSMDGYPYMLSAGCEVPAEVSDEVFEAFCKTPQII